MTRTAHIQIVGWNHREHLDACVKSCLNQTMKIPVLYIDNASSDGSAEYIKKTFPNVRVHWNADNRGYSGGHNDGFRLMPDSEIVILLNPDVVLNQRFVEEILKPFENERVGAAVPLLGRGKWDVGNGKGSHSTQTIDSYGTVLTRSLRAIHQYEGMSLPTSSFPPPASHPWGFTGAAVALRRTALSDVAINGEVLDEDLFAYREDVDLSWRLHHRNWKIVGAPAARATHERQVKRGADKSSWARQLSWRNYFLVLVKNVPARTFVLHSIPLLLESTVRLVFGILDLRLWPAIPELLRLTPRMLQKRQAQSFQS